MMQHVAHQAAPPRAGSGEGVFPLSPAQHRFFELGFVDPHHMNIGVIFTLSHRLTVDQIRAALNALARHHEELRANFDPLRPSQRVATAGTPVPLRQIDISGLSADDQGGAIEREVSSLQRSFHFEEGLLVHSALFDAGPEQPQRLVFIMHHLLGDAISSQILHEDLDILCAQAVRGEPLGLPTKSMHYGRWAERLEAYANSEELAREKGYWFSQTRGAETPLPRDLPGTPADNTLDAAETLVAELDAADSDALRRRVRAIPGAQVMDAVVAGIVLSVANWSGRAVPMELFSNGRESPFSDVDVWRTIGWFASVYPVALGIEPGTPPPLALRGVRDGLRAVRHGGLGYSVLRYNGIRDDAGRALTELPEAEIALNYRGYFSRSQEAPARTVLRRVDLAKDGQTLASLRRYVFYLEAGFVQGNLQFRWMYGPALHRKKTVEKLAADCLSALLGMV